MIPLTPTLSHPEENFFHFMNSGELTGRFFWHCWGQKGTNKKGRESSAFSPQSEDESPGFIRPPACCYSIQILTVSLSS